MAHCIPNEIGGRVLRLAEAYEIVWATGWEERANDRLPEILGLPEHLPFLTFDGKARFGTAHWKIDAIDRYAGDRPLAWVDDCLDPACEDWAAMRAHRPSWSRPIPPLGPHRCSRTRGGGSLPEAAVPARDDTA